MRLKTEKTNAKDATDACKEALFRRGFKPRTYSTKGLHLGGDKPGEVYDVWLPFEDEYRWDLFVTINKGTIGPASKTNDWVDWDRTNKIILKLV